MRYCGELFKFTMSDVLLVCSCVLLCVYSWVDCAALVYPFDCELVFGNRLVVADRARACLVVYDADSGEECARWGRMGDTPGAFSTCVSIAAAAGRLFVLDNNSGRVHVFE